MFLGEKQRQNETYTIVDVWLSRLVRLTSDECYSLTSTGERISPLKSDMFFQSVSIGERRKANAASTVRFQCHRTWRRHLRNKVRKKIRANSRPDEKK